METMGMETNAVGASGHRRETTARVLPKTIGRAAIGLGLFGLGLGLAELLAPRRFNRMIGVRDNRRGRRVTRAFGVREIANSLAVLGSRPAPWLWMRFAGDLLDLALLANATRARRAQVGRIAGAIGAVLGAPVMDAYVAARSHGRTRIDA